MINIKNKTNVRHLFIKLLAFRKWRLEPIMILLKFNQKLVPSFSSKKRGCSFQNNLFFLDVVTYGFTQL
jgi:hypothetical protein